MIEVVIMVVAGHGYLPLVLQAGIERYRGEYQPSAEQALQRAQEALSRLEGAR